MPMSPLTDIMVSVESLEDRFDALVEGLGTPSEADDKTEGDGPTSVSDRPRGSGLRAIRPGRNAGPSRHDRQRKP